MPSPRPPMTKTVVKKVSSNVKVLRPGSKPLTQTNTEKAKIAEKAKAKTPAAREKAAEQAKYKASQSAREERYNRNSLRQRTYKEALTAAGYKPATFSEMPTAAQTKAANKAVAAIEVKIKASKVARTAATKARGGSGIRGGLGIGGLRGNVNR